MRYGGGGGGWCDRSWTWAHIISFAIVVCKCPILTVVNWAWFGLHLTLNYLQLNDIRAQWKCKFLFFVGKCDILHQLTYIGKKQLDFHLSPGDVMDARRFWELSIHLHNIRIAWLFIKPKSRKSNWPWYDTEQGHKGFRTWTTPLIMDIYNCSLREGYVPDLLKWSIINPLPLFSAARNPIWLETYLSDMHTCQSHRGVCAQQARGENCGKTWSTPVRKGRALHHAALIYILQAIHEATELWELWG